MAKGYDKSNRRRQKREEEKKSKGGEQKIEPLKMPDGSVIESTENLEYGEDDSNIPPEARKSIEEFEKKRVKAKVEYGYAVDENGNPLGKEKRGSSGQVKTPYSWHVAGTTFSHIHPREDGVLGGTFSEGDMMVFAYHGGEHMRASAKEGTYSISKLKNFDSQGFIKYAKECNQKYSELVKKTSEELKQKIKTMSHDDALKEWARVCNDNLIQLHNMWADGASKYGYFYTLERRKS